MLEIEKSMRIILSCYCCGSINFERKEMRWNEIENMHFLYEEDKQIVKCLNCGLEDNIQNLVPRGFVHEELVDK